MNLENLKYLIVGCGFWGAVLAERIATDRAERVLIIDKRRHIGGNCFSEIDSGTGIEYHSYGTHIFHTSSRKVWEYINRFTEFNGYRHQVLATYRGRVYQMPINLETINTFYGVSLKPFEAAPFLQHEIEKDKVASPSNLEEKAIQLIGRPLYEAFIKGYTRKQWQKDCTELPSAIVERLPVRLNYDESYYFDRWQGIPLDGYATMFSRLLKHDHVDVALDVDYFKIKDLVPRDCLIFYSGQIDEFFSYKFGPLEWRTLKFEKKAAEVNDFQGTAVMNYTEEEVPYTRIHEPRHLHPERSYATDRTLLVYEYPNAYAGAGDNPYYPVNTLANQDHFAKYSAEKVKQTNVVFGGRLGDYRYYDMDQVIASALDTYEKHLPR